MTILKIFDAFSFQSSNQSVNQPQTPPQTRQTQSKNAEIKKMLKNPELVGKLSEAEAKSLALSINLEDEEPEEKNLAINTDSDTFDEEGKYPIPSDFYLDVDNRFVKLRNNSDLGLEWFPGADVINIREKYVILCVNKIKPKKSIVYAMSTPLACMTWIHIGYGCIVLFTYDEDEMDDKYNEKSEVTSDDLNGYVLVWK